MTLIVPVLQNKRSGSNQNLHRKSGIENRVKMQLRNQHGDIVVPTTHFSM